MMKTNDSILTSRALDLYRASEYAVSATDFLSPGERVRTAGELNARIGSGMAGCFFWGGCRGAERCTAVFLPEWLMPDGMPPHRMPDDEERTEAFAAYLTAHPEIRDDIPVTGLLIRGSGFCTLTHRDFMGGILSTGVDRAVIGDIAVIGDAEALVFVQKRIADYLTKELTRIGRDAVHAEVYDVSPDYVIPRRYEEMTVTVSSPRLDGIVKALTGKSREAAADMVRDGLAELNYEANLEAAADVHDGDVLSIRGYGKYRIGGLNGQTRSGRLKISCKKYL